MMPRFTDRPDPNKFGKQAYTRAHDGQFKKFAAYKKPNATFDYINHTEAFICEECGVIALRFIDSTPPPENAENPEAIAKWQALDAEYQDWLVQQENK